MELIISISNDPISGFQRNVKVSNFNWSLDDSLIDLSCLVQNMFSQKGTKGTTRIKDYQVQLRCDNHSTVDPKNGEFVLVNADGIALDTDPITGDPLVGVGQYDFYIALAQAGPIDVIGLIRMLVLRADSLKRFDI